MYCKNYVIKIYKYIKYWIDCRYFATVASVILSLAFASLRGYMLQIQDGRIFRSDFEIIMQSGK